MNQDDVIRLAREVGMAGMLTDVVTTLDELKRFAALVAAHEREECAKVSDEWLLKMNWHIGSGIAEEIRARGQA